MNIWWFERADVTLVHTDMTSKGSTIYQLSIATFHAPNCVGKYSNMIYYSDVIMGAMVSQITSFMIVYQPFIQIYAD